LGGLSLIPVIIWVKASKPDTRTERRKHLQHINLERAGIACGLALFIAMSIQQYCMQYVGAGKAGFITALYIIFVPILAVLFGEKLRKRVVVSVFLAFIGLYLLCYKAGSGFNIWDLLLLLSAFFYAVHIMVVNYYSRVVNPIKASCAQFFVVGILSAILVLLFEKPNLEAIIACKIPILYAGVVTCGVAYTLQIYGQKYTLPVLASLIFSLESVFAVIGGSVILGEVMNLKEITGCIFMICGVILSNMRSNRKQAIK
jgi:drug/metabolite transporter (DMT)-like permease